VTSAQAQLNRARSELAGDLLSRRRQHVLQSEADRCVQRCDKALGERTSVITTGLGGNRQLVVDVIDVEPQIHGAIYGTIMVPYQTNTCHDGATTATVGGRAAARLRRRSLIPLAYIPLTALREVTGTIGHHVSATE